MRFALLLSFLFSTVLITTVAFAADDTPRILPVEGQPLGANIARLTQTLDFLGAPLPNSLVTKLEAAAKKRDAKELQKLLDPHATFVVSLNPEVRVKVGRGPGTATIQQGGFAPLLVKVINESTVTRQLRIRSPDRFIRERHWRFSNARLRPSSTKTKMQKAKPTASWKSTSSRNHR